MLRTNYEVVVFEKIVDLSVRFFCFQNRKLKKKLSVSAFRTQQPFLFHVVCSQATKKFPRSLILDLGPKRSERRKKDLKMWIPVITLAALLGHTSGQFQQPFPQNGFPQSGFPQAQSAFPQGAFPQTGFPSIWDTIAQSR